MGHQESTEHPEVEWPRRKNARATDVGDALLRLFVGGDDPIYATEPARVARAGSVDLRTMRRKPSAFGRPRSESDRRQFTLYRSTGLITLLAL